MSFMFILLIQGLIAAIVSGLLCGYIGVYLKRLGLITLGFAVAHGAIAGASIAFMLGLNVEMLAFTFGVLVAIVIEILHNRFDVDRELASMFVFSLSSSLAIIAIYLTPSILLTSDIAIVILWGSILSMTRERIIFLGIILISILLYVSAFRLEIDSLLFDPKLAEAEGINTELHALAFILISSLTITVLLRFIGGLLLFTLLFVPATTSTTITYKNQEAVGALIGAIAGAIGLLLSFRFDLPVGSTMALSICTIAIILEIVNTLIHTKKIMH